MKPITFQGKQYDVVQEDGNITLQGISEDIEFPGLESVLNHAAQRDYSENVLSEMPYKHRAEHQFAPSDYVERFIEENIEDFCELYKGSALVYKHELN